MKRYTVEVNEHQLRLIAQCIEDLNRFYSGQMGLSNDSQTRKSNRLLTNGGLICLVNKK